MKFIIKFLIGFVLISLIYTYYATDQCRYRGSVLGITSEYDIVKGCLVYNPLTKTWITPEEADKIPLLFLKTK
jgi:hypothetical protein